VRLPFPERVSLIPVIGFAIVLCILQVYNGTSAPFALCCFLFIIIATVAFNVAGGLTRPSGSYIFFYAVLVLIVGVTWKTVLGEAADSNLSAPMLTIEIYLVSICSMLGAAYLSRRLTTKKALLAQLDTDDNMQNATVGCLITGLVITLILDLSTVGTGTVLSGLRQLDHFLLLALCLGTVHAIRRSGGTASISLPVIIAGAFLFISGILGFSKEGMMTPFLGWLMAASSQRYRVNISQIAIAILVTFVIFQYLVPYSQYGRNFQTNTLSGNIDVSINLLTNIEDVRSHFSESEEEADEDLNSGYYSTHQGFFDRLQMISPDDQLNNYTQQTVPMGITPVFLYFANLIPHFIWRDKPGWYGGNIYAHQLGGLSDDDESTGVSFSPSAEAFHLMGWTGILIIAPILWTMLFTLFDSLCGDVRKSPWGLIAIMSFAHVAPEGGIGAMIYDMGYLTLGILFAAWTATYVMPLLGQLLIGPNRKVVSFRLPPTSARVSP
jgi:hypothetical protein